MSSSPMYDLGVVPVLKALANLLSFTKKAAKWAEENNVSEENVIDAKLVDDMKALAFQIQSACNAAKFIPVRAAGVENVSKDDNEKTLAELYDRIQWTIDFLKKEATPEVFKGKETGEVIVKAGPNTLKFNGLSYMQDFALPNFFFHHVMAYAVLRKIGAPIGKFDYLDGDGKIQAEMTKAS